MKSVSTKLDLPITYEVKNTCCLFERIFKVKKNNALFRSGICAFLYYANMRKVITSLVVPLK